MGRARRRLLAPDRRIPLRLGSRSARPDRSYGAEWKGRMPRPGLHIRHAQLDDADTCERHGAPVTSPVRTAFDLARHLPLAEAVAAVDMALHQRLLDLAALEQYVLDRPCWQGVIQARRVAELAEPATESWMESVLRMTLIGGGLPRPRVQATLVSSAG